MDAPRECVGTRDSKDPLRHYFFGTNFRALSAARRSEHEVYVGLLSYFSMIGRLFFETALPGVGVRCLQI